MTEPNFIAGYIVDPEAEKEPLYLLLRRSKNSTFPGIWQMITGKLHLQESASLAIQREILEETGLLCQKIYSVDVTAFYDQSKKQIAFSANFCAFTNHLNTIKLLPNEHDQYQWCTLLEAINLLAFPAQKETLNLIHKHYVLQKPHAANILRVEPAQ